MVQSQGPQSLTISGLAAAGGVGVETVRFYQRKGLLGQPTREGGIRRYGSQDVRRLRFIKQAQAAGFTLEEIRELVELDASEHRARARELASARVKALDCKMAELKRARDALQRLAKECAEGIAGPVPNPHVVRGLTQHPTARPSPASCTGGQGTSAYEQKTQQSPLSGRSTSPQWRQS